MIVVTVSDIIGLTLFGLLVIIVLSFAIPRWWKQWRCDHLKYPFYETTACDAICTNCGKNLGFIGTERERRSKIWSGKDMGL